MVGESGGEGDGKATLFRWRDAFTGRDPVEGVPLPHPTIRHVLLTLSLSMNSRGEQGFPSTRELARQTGLSRRTVERRLQEAEELGWIERESRGGGRGWKRHEYRPRIPTPEPTDPWAEKEPPDDDTFPSAFFVDGVREVLWLDEEPPDAAPEGWDVGADLADLRTAWRNLGSERLRRSLLGLRLLADAGELPGVEPGEGFTLGLMKRLRGNGVWRAAEEAYRREHEGDDDQEGGPSPLEEAAGELLAEMEEAAHG